ncbi:hypothetical protein ACFPFV_12435 [Salinicoccus siamensis]
MSSLLVWRSCRTDVKKPYFAEPEMQYGEGLVVTAGKPEKY